MSIQELQMLGRFGYATLAGLTFLCLWRGDWRSIEVCGITLATFLTVQAVLGLLVYPGGVLAQRDAVSLNSLSALTFVAALVAGLVRR